MQDEMNHETSVKKVSSLFEKLPEGTREQAETYYKKIVGSKKLSPEEATEFAEMATLYVQRNASKAEKKENRIFSSASMNI